mmetsp:Transcript_9128/g.24596  ORF Transcript_9128/g.24596 Transcript_9128/m.24596 type:complete len:83 (-) Transcript_9128:202-450(-)
MMLELGVMGAAADLKASIKPAAAATTSGAASSATGKQTACSTEAAGKEATGYATAGTHDGKDAELIGKRQRLPSAKQRGSCS